jgi:hypothetical protein
MSVNINGMGAEQLMALRAKIDYALYSQAFATGGHGFAAPATKLKFTGLPTVNGGKARKSLKGSKVAPKYRDPKTGKTWAGRGVKPKWVKQSHFIGKTA